MKTVLCNGVFDLLHMGHILHLQAAKELGFLVVSVTDDAYVNKTGRPIYPASQRAAILKALKCVDDVLIVRGLEDALRKVEPHILVKGKDYADSIELVHRQYCINHDIEIHFTDTEKYSTSAFIDEIRRRS